MNNRLGRQTVTFDNPPIIIETASTVGQKEGKGPLKSTFDVILDDDTLGEKSWEKSESMLQKKTALLALEKAKLQQSDIDYILAGDLLNQCVGAHYSVRDFDIPFLGLYGACSTMTESMSIGSMIVSAGFADYAMCLTSSHFCSSEIQFRNPLEYGGQRTPSAQWTVTGAGCAILSSKGTGPKITHVTTGKVIDKGVTDISNMGAAMAPAAIDTLIAHFNDTRKTDSHGGCAGRLRLGHSGAVFPGAVRGDRSLPPGLDGAPVASGSAPAVPCGTEAGDGAGFGPVRGQRRSACTPLPHMV